MRKAPRSYVSFKMKYASILFRCPRSRSKRPIPFHKFKHKTFYRFYRLLLYTTWIDFFYDIYSYGANKKSPQRHKIYRRFMDESDGHTSMVYAMKWDGTCVHTFTLIVSFEIHAHYEPIEVIWFRLFVCWMCVRVSLYACMHVSVCAFNECGMDEFTCVFIEINYCFRFWCR